MTTCRLTISMKFTKPIPIYIVLLLVLSFRIQAQQVPQFTQYSLIGLAYNPAYCGSKDGINIEGAFRAQWLGINERPITQSLGVHVPMPIWRSGVGLNVVNDALGLERKTSIYLNYAYSKVLGQNSAISGGIQAGIIQKGWRGDRFISPDGEYELGGINHNDNFIPVGAVASIAPDINLGLLYKTRNLWIGVSVLQLLEPKNAFTWADNKVKVVNKRHFLAHIAYDIELNRILNVTPSLLVKTDLVKYQLDFGANVTYNRMFHGGVFIRGYERSSLDAVAISAGVSLGEKWLISYAYDIGISKLRNFNSGSHELVVHYKISKFVSEKGGKTIYNPRFM